MAEFDLNLSTQPFPAYRLTNLALATVLVLLVVISVWQGYGFLQYSSLVASLRPDQRAARAESETLRQEVDVLKAKLDRPESAAKLSEIGFLNRIIARKDLSWTQLFATLETLVPETVHLVSLRPEILSNGTATLSIVARARSIPDVKDFIAALELSPAFEKVLVSNEQAASGTPGGGGTDIMVTLTAHYVPDREVR